MDPEKPYRLIYSLQLDLAPPPDAKPGVSCQLIVLLDRAGNACGRVYPRPPKTRMIDVRPGDEILHDGRYIRVLKVEAYRDAWVGEEYAKNVPHEQGYLYRVGG
jgi:hypothetical protein